MDKELRVWEQMIESNIGYWRPKRWEIILKSEYGQSCLNFVFQEETDHFAETLHHYLSLPAPVHTIQTPITLNHVRKVNMVSKPSSYKGDGSNVSHSADKPLASICNQGKLGKLKEANNDYKGIDLTQERYRAYDE